MSSNCLQGNFAPIQRQLSLEPCTYSGSIPAELEDGQYIRNGGNPSFGHDVAGDMHMFDGDGMLSGVLFKRCDGSEVVPHFVNRYILTDIYVASKSMHDLSTPILPSITTLLRSFSSAFSVLYSIGRFVFLVLWSHLKTSALSIRKISVANTALLYHDRRALATCQTGPPMRVQLPNLETVGWYNGESADNELPASTTRNVKDAFGGSGLFGFLKNWATAHPRVDPTTGELISFQSSFLPPYAWYSVIPTAALLKNPSSEVTNVSIPGIASPKFMHDFGVSSRHTVILDLPLSLNPLNLVRGRSIIHYDKTSPSRFGVFPRRNPKVVRWFETEACFIFHTAGTWDEESTGPAGEITEQAVNMLACRYTNATVLHSTGGLKPPMRSEYAAYAADGCLYYYRFLLSPTSHNIITHQWALSAVPFELPTTSPSCSMAAPDFVYGCSSMDSVFGEHVGRPMKVDCIVKIDAKTLIRRGIREETPAVSGCVDSRTIQEIYASIDPDDPIKVFQAPEGWYAQEPQFVPREDGNGEDDGYLLTLMFDESQLDANGDAPVHARSELWILDARDMETVLAKVLLPQRVPYGFHGHWFSRQQIEAQRPFMSTRTAQMPSL